MSLLQKVKSGMGSPDWHVWMFNIHLRNLLWLYCPGHAWVKEKWYSGGQSSHYKRFASWKIWSVEELETVPAGTKWRTSHHDRLEERHGKKKCSTIFHEKTREGHQQSVLREKAINNQLNIGKVSKTTVGKFMKDGVERVWDFRSALLPPWTELNVVVKSRSRNGFS